MGVGVVGVCLNLGAKQMGEAAVELAQPSRVELATKRHKKTKQSVDR